MELSIRSYKTHELTSDEIASWRDLFSKTTTSFFQDPEWYQAWNYYHPVKNQYIHFVRLGATLVTVVPTRRKIICGVNVHELLPNSFADYSEPLMDPTMGAADMSAILVRLIRKPIGMLIAYNVSEKSSFFSTLQNQLDPTIRVYKHMRVLCPYLQLDRFTDYSNYLSTRSKSLRQELRTARNRLVRHKVGSLFEVVHTFTVELLDKLQQIHLSRIRSTAGRSSLFQDIMKRKTLREYFLSTDFRVTRFCALLRIGDSIAAYALCVRSGNTVYYWNVAYDPRYEKYSPGKLLLSNLIEWGFVNGVSILDFMTGDEPYKSEWSTGKNSNYDLVLFLDRFYYKIIANAIVKVKPKLRALYKWMNL